MMLIKDQKRNGEGEKLSQSGGWKVLLLEAKVVSS